MEQKGPKTEFMQGEGYVLYSSIGHKLLDHFQNMTPHKIDAYVHRRGNFIHLFHIANQLTREAECRISRQDIGFTTDDHNAILGAMTNGADIFGSGVDDLEFPFHFIPILLKDILDHTHEQFGLTREDVARFTMQDFAHIMREPWFQGILSDTAKTANGMWGGLGGFDIDYEKEHAILDGIDFQGKADEVYDVVFEPERLIAQVGLSRVFKEYLTGKLRGQDTVGCPVAAHSRIINPANPHAQRLIQNGYMSARQRRDGQIVGRQEQTPIERSAEVLADFLEKYVEKFGEPGEH